jgi:hypothetical protein
MPTEEQLRAEAVWRAELVSDELAWLVDALCAHFGVPRGNGGTKGDRYHLSGGHRSQRWILTSRWCTNRSYTVEGGLSPALVDCIAAFDVTLPPAGMVAISRAADRATRSGQLEELVEWYGNLGGDERVDGWDNIRDRVASSDSSHLWHFHGRIRRALLRDIGTMRRVFAALTGGEMPIELNTQLPDPFGNEQLPNGKVVNAGSIDFNTRMVATHRLAYAAKVLTEDVFNMTVKLGAASAAEATRDATLLAVVEALAVGSGADPQPIFDAIAEAAAGVRELVERRHAEEMAALRAERDAEVAGLRAELAALDGATPA